MHRRTWPLLLVALALPAAALPAAAEKHYAIPLEGSPAQGPENAPVTVVEFLDFQ